jgi:uncharacterized protein YndB with AHSA1/START domain
MADKKPFNAEYEFHASAKLLYPYLQTASGMAEWLADDVRITPEKILILKWGDDQRKARLEALRMNHFVRYKFLDDKGNEPDDPDRLEFRVETDDLTQLTYLKISDYSDFGDEEEQEEFWDDLVGKLKTIVGG